MSRSTTTSAVWARRVAIAVIAAGVAYVMFIIWDRQAVARWMSEASAVPFFIAMAVLPVVGAPLTPFMLLAGATFGVWGGLIGSISALAVSLCLAYAIGRSKLQRHIKALFERFDYEIPDFAAGGRSAWRFATAVKLTPALPMVAKMYIPAVTAVPFAIYFAVSLVIGSAFAVGWIVLGESLFSHDLDHATIAVIAIVVLVVVAVIWWRRRGQISDDAVPA